jgi:dephospho-CoA kinase
VLLLSKSHPSTKENGLRTPVYGLTGGIASGKSTVLELFTQLGVETRDTDQLARQVINPGSLGVQALEQAIGSKYFMDGALNRGLLRQEMYRAPSLKKKVESVVHPLVRAAVTAWISSDTNSLYRILCSPLLIETQQHKTLDGIIVVDAPEICQVIRAAQRDKNSTTRVQQIIDAQLPRLTRLEHASYVIDNSNDLTSLTNQVNELHETLKHD